MVWIDSIWFNRETMWGDIELIRNYLCLWGIEYEHRKWNRKIMGSVSFAKWLNITTVGQKMHNYGFWMGRVKIRTIQLYENTIIIEQHLILN